MTRHRILCVDLALSAAPHDVAHPFRVGTASEMDPSRVVKLWTGPEVVAAMAAGDEFYTRRPTTRGDGSVFGFKCRMCGQETFRSGPDAEDHNKLERLPRCPQ